MYISIFMHFVHFCIWHAFGLYPSKPTARIGGYKDQFGGRACGDGFVCPQSVGLVPCLPCHVDSRYISRLSGSAAFLP